jgi:hypothetical protein
MDGGHLKDVCTEGRIALECVWRIQDGKAWMREVRVRIETSSRLL